MGAKEIAILVVFCIFVLPLLIEILVWTAGMNSHSPEQNTEKATDLITKAAVPWWINILEGLSKLGTFGAFIILGFIVFLMWIGEIGNSR
ncbi:hypothetical protein KKC59_01470 [bacterium]|nr:hypothetical protein [bacterium]